MSTESHKIYQNFSECLEKALLLDQISASDLAKRIDKHRSQISRYLKKEDRITPTRSTLRQINGGLEQSEIIEVTNGWVLKESEEVRNIMSEVLKAEEEGDAYILDVLNEGSASQKIELAQKLLEAALRSLDQRDKS